MRQYGLSEARVLRIIHTPARVEDGVADKTIAFMQKAGSKAHPNELWTMVQDVGQKRKIISAWRYPGVTKPRGEAAMNFIRAELEDFLVKEEEPPKPKPKLKKWFKPQVKTMPKQPWPKRKFQSFRNIKLGEADKI